MTKKAGILCKLCGGDMKVYISKKKDGYVSRTRKCKKCGHCKPTTEK